MRRKRILIDRFEHRSITELMASSFVAGDLSVQYVEVEKRPLGMTPDGIKIEEIKYELRMVESRKALVVSTRNILDLA